MNIGGFIKLSATWNFTGGPFSNGQTGVEGSGAGAYSGIEGSQADNRNGGHWEMTARRSRFWIQTWTPSDWGELRTYIETDFASRVGQTSSPDAGGISRAGEMLRLRHAYGTLGPVLAGKTNTVFGGLIGAPEVLDDAAPIVAGALRIPQLRYTHNLGGGLVAIVALEEAGNIADSGSVIVGASCNLARRAPRCRRMHGSGLRVAEPSTARNAGRTSPRPCSGISPNGALY